MTNLKENGFAFNNRQLVGLIATRMHGIEELAEIGAAIVKYIVDIKKETLSQVLNPVLTENGKV